MSSAESLHSLCPKRVKDIVKPSVRQFPVKNGKNGTVEQPEAPAVRTLQQVIDDAQEEEIEEDVSVRGSSWSVAAYTIMVVFGLSFAVFAAHHLVEYARLIAIELNVPHAIVGTTVSGIGTSLPELTIALMAAKRSQGVAIGTLIGSNITDPLLSIGLAGLVHPLAISDTGFGLIVYIIIPFTILGCFVALLMMRTSYEFKKWEGYTLILLYILFILMLEAYNRSWITF